MSGDRAAPLGLLVMAYGTPRTPEDVEAYYTHIRRGRPPTPELLADLTARYDAIGGISPLAALTEAQRAALADALEARQPGRWKVVLGQKHAAPFIEDGVAELAAAGVHDMVGLVLAPHYSGFSVGQYQQRAADAGDEHAMALHRIDRWHLLPAYLDFLAAAVTDARASLPADHKVLFTAHSLPERVLEGDPYPDELRQTAAAVAERVGLSPWPEWALAWQSAGRTPEPWRGPDVLEVIRDLAATGRTDGVLVCAQGFTADHLEVLYDLDIEASGIAAEVGLAFARTRSLNAEPTVMAALADEVVRVAEAGLAP
ncbi:ferrochelatase [Rhabdothermincola salaria]|uniref:ferrochelatase n=1 Tax=Rhabdothermincola salaria TaxID=2903142 RepID=UPI001E3F24E0|nr:ferrochelatase [Rhabdothermincola salaria]MCD9624795.1 ferrochelatase [Rhabdothermincola salaria]